LHKSNIERQHRPILDQPPADWIYDRHSPRESGLSDSRPALSAVLLATEPASRHPGDICLRAPSGCGYIRRLVEIGLKAKK
jgi:hypothetical protein